MQRAHELFQEWEKGCADPQSAGHRSSPRSPTTKSIKSLRQSRPLQEVSVNIPDVTSPLTARVDSLRGRIAKLSLALSDT
mmetsp:Transcript_2269/g.6888  ORF Transcript_2269/g.6888 Transcript_2269/m.6888 type:complete len:80 (+) Transcript_2269:1048-1287(+)